MGAYRRLDNMTEEELQELLVDCPTLYHMAERHSWPSISARGLLSTTALLDSFAVYGEERKKIEAKHRPASVTISDSTSGSVVIRDQIPMDDGGLRRCLPPEITPADWYRLLNGKVFFWLTRERLLRLTNAAAYRDRCHDVLEINASLLVSAYRNSIWFCPINSGCTKPMPAPRDLSTFLQITDYPYATWRKRRKRGERVVELAVEYSVPDVWRFVTRVTEMRGGTELSTIYMA